MGDNAKKRSGEKFSQYQIPKTRKNVKISSFEDKNDILRSHKKILNLAQPVKNKHGEVQLDQQEFTNFGTSMMDNQSQLPQWDGKQMRTGSQPKMQSQFGISVQHGVKHDSETTRRGARRHKFQPKMTPFKSVARPGTALNQSSHKSSTTAVFTQRNMNFNSKFKSNIYNEPMLMRSHHDLMRKSKPSAERRPLPPTILGNDLGEVAHAGVTNQHDTTGVIFIQTQNASNDQTNAEHYPDQSNQMIDPVVCPNLSDTQHGDLQGSEHIADH